MVWPVDGRAPEGHHAVTDVLVDGAQVVGPDHARELGQQRVHQLAEGSRLHLLGQGGEAPHVGKHHGQLGGARRHGVARRVLVHLAHQLGRHVLAEELVDCVLGARFEQVSQDVQADEKRGNLGQRQGHRQHGAVIQPQAETYPQHGNGRSHRGQRERHGAKAPGTEEHHQSHHPHHGENGGVGVMRPTGQLPRERPLQVRSVQFDPGLIAVHRRGSAVLQPGGRGPQHDHAALEHGRVCAAFQHLQHRQRGHRTTPAKERNQRAALAVNRQPEGAHRQVLSHRLAVQRRLLPKLHHRLLAGQQGQHTE